MDCTGSSLSFQKRRRRQRGQQEGQSGPEAEEQALGQGQEAEDQEQKEVIIRRAARVEQKRKEAASDVEKGEICCSFVFYRQVKASSVQRSADFLLWRQVC